MRKDVVKSQTFIMFAPPFFGGDYKELIYNQKKK